MLLTISTTYKPATDLGFLLEKHPDRVHEFDVTGGKATVFYPEATDDRCTIALLLDVDPIGLIRGKGGHKTDSGLDQYVNDRPYVASSFLSVAIGTAFRSALSGRSRSRSELVASAIPLEAKIAVLPCRGGESFLRSLFEPLGYEVDARAIQLDEKFPDWGFSSYFSVALRANTAVQILLQHLYVLIPVLDDDKHYWVGDAEVDKLLRHASEWLKSHPLKERIAQRYFKHRKSLARDALSRLVVEDSEESSEEGVILPESQLREQKIEERLNLNLQRMNEVQACVDRFGAKSVVDLGCGEGRLLSGLLKLKQLTRIVGVDVSIRSLEIAHDRLNLDRMPPMQRSRITLQQGSLIYKDDRLKGFDVATVVEVIEHMDLSRLASFERVVFEFARPQVVLITTPNSEYNVRFENLKPGQFRHGDHRFEWTRAEFRDWCSTQSSRFGYTVSYASIGEEDPIHGPPTQMAIFEIGMPSGETLAA